MARPHPEPRAAVTRSSSILVYMLLLVSLQIFLLVVALEGLLGNEPHLARNAALLSLGLFGSSLAMRWFVGDE